MDQARGEAPAQWRRVRRLLNEHRMALAAMAAGLYPDLPRVAGTDLLCWPGWLPATPLDLADVPLRWVSDPPPPAVAATGAAAAHVLPRLVTGRAYPTYAAAIEALDRPALFENRVCYRLLDADLGGAARSSRPGLRFGPSRYFDAVNLGAAVGHELAAAWASAGTAPGLADLPLRACVGDPCALPRRSALTAVTTLTLRRAHDGTASFLMHWRDPARVNHAGGLYQVMPAGIFQPVSAARSAQRHDFSLWRCMTREFSEELLGGSEEYPTRGGRLDYGRWPFHRELAAARDAGTLRVSCVGLGVDPLTLATDILTVAVFEAAVFDHVFRGLVGENAEGRVVTQDGSAAIPFTGANVTRYTGGAEPVQTAGQALLRLAWQHREFLGVCSLPSLALVGAQGPDWVKSRASDGRWEDSMATKPVIAGADGSQESLRAVEWAAREAALRATSLRIVAVPELPPRMTSTPATPGTVSDVVEKSTSQALAAAAEQAAAQQPGLAIDTQLLAGAPAEVLVGAGQDASMLVLGSRGDGGFTAMILGSTSRYVATHAPAPVVVVREETQSGPGEVVVGVRDPAQSAAALGFGFEEAALRQARLLAVHAWSSPIPGRTEAPAEEASRLESAVAAWREKFPEVEARWEVVRAHPGRVLAGSSARADLVVLGRHALGGPHTLGVRSVTHAVLGHAHGPVVSVPGD